jgi:hypothetical protein
MGAYADLVASEEYQSKHTGSALQVVIIDAASPGELVIGATTGSNCSEDFEVVPVEESGNDGVDEIAQGRHSGTLSVPGFWTPQWNDSLPSRQSFIGREFIVMEKIGINRPNAGTVVNVWEGAKISRYGQSNGARGAKTLDLAFSFTTRYNGAEWALKTGS